MVVILHIVISLIVIFRDLLHLVKCERKGGGENIEKITLYREFSRLETAMERIFIPHYPVICRDGAVYVWKDWGSPTHGADTLCLS